MEITRGKIQKAKKVVIYGPEGIGKSTFAARFPGAVFIDTEGSTNDMDVARLPRPTSWNMLFDEIEYIKTHTDECRTLVIDTVDWAELLCVEHICAVHNKKEGAIYKRFADNPEKFRCEVLEGPADNPEHKQFRKNDIVSIEIGLDFGGNQSGHSFVARGYTDDYRDVIGIMSKRVMAKDQEKDIDSNMLDQLFCDFVQEVIDKYGVIVKHGDYVEYCNVGSVYYDNAETVLGNSIRNAVEKRFPWIIVRKAKKASIIDRIRCTVRLMGAGRFWITEDCKSLQTALSDAVWNKDVKDKDERLDDGSTDIDSLDAFEYTIERDMRDLIEEVEDV